jgi:DnaJ family protein C protein 3
MPGMEEDEDGLVGRGESLLLKEEWEEAVRVLDKAFDASGRSSRDVSVAGFPPSCWACGTDVIF